MSNKITKDVFFKICDFMEELYGDKVKPEDYPFMYDKILQCISNNNYILDIDKYGNVITYQGWFIKGNTIWIEDCCTINKKVAIKNLINELKLRYRNKGFKFVSYLKRCVKPVTFNIERYTKHESF